MDDKEWLAERFEERRPQLRAVAYRMLGSVAEADDAVQNAWERVNRAGANEVENLIAVLHPDVVLRADFSPGRPDRSTVIRGAATIARKARLGASPTAKVHPALVNGTSGVVITRHGRPALIMAFTICRGKIVEIDSIGDPERVEKLAAAIL